MSEYLGEFVQESEESITELNNALLELERDRSDAAMDQVFRTAHTLKGNCGAMGFDGARDLAHAIEDVLDAVRAGSLSVSPELMDDVFDAVDDLERMIGEVDRHGDVKTDPTSRIEDLRSRTEASTGLTSPTPVETESVLSGASQLPRSDHRAFHARLSLSGPDEVETALTALSDAFDLLATDPTDPDDLARAETLDVVFGSAVDEAAVAAALDPVDAVEDAFITEVDPDVVDRTLGVGVVDDEAPEQETSSTADADDMEVDELLDEFDEYDDLDQAADRVDDVAGLEKMGDAGAFDDIIEEEVDPVHETSPADESATDAESATPVDEVPEPAGAEEEVEDAMSEFRTMQSEHDTVGLDEIETELADVEFGEFDDEEEVGFDELLDDEKVTATGDAAAVEADVESATPDADEVPSVSAPADDAIDALMETARPPATLERGVHHVRLAVPSGDATVGEQVVDALRDAFDLLGTDPTEPDIVAGDHDGEIDALFGSDLGDEELRAALVSVDPVADVHLAAVTDRGTSRAEAAPETDSEPAPDPAVVDAEGEIEDAMSEFRTMQSEYDTVGLDEIETELADVEFGEFDDQEEVGFDELLGDEEVTATGDAAAVEAEAEAESTETASDPAPLAEPTETEIEATVDAADGTLQPDRNGYYLSLQVRGDSDRNNARRVVEGLRDAFDLLGTRPSTAAIADGDRAQLEAVIGSHVSETEIRSALADVDEVLGAHLVEVTDRLPTADTEDSVEDPMDEFRAVQEEYEAVGVEEIEAELETADITGISPDEEVGFDELLDPAEPDLVEADADGDGMAIDDVEVEGELDDVAAGSELGVDVDLGAGETADESASDPASEPASPDTEPSVPDAATADVETVKGIGSSYSERLTEAGVETVGDLVTAEVPVLVEATGISDGRIEEWIERAPVSATEVRPDSDTETTAPEAADVETVQSIRVDVDQVDELLTLVEELVTSRARMRRVLQETDADLAPLAEALDELDVIGTEMQEVVMDMRLVPVRTATQRLPRIVRDIARDQGKRVRFDVEGEAVELDRSILSRMDDPLVHLVRNAVDHGIESPEEREAAGKPEKGRVTLRAYRARDTVYIEVEDDGRGLDPDDLRETAVEEGVLSEEAARRLSEEAARELVFESGLTTRDEVTDVSGRGVGMDIVASTVEELDGDIEIESEVGDGTTIRLALPVSVAISEVLFMEVGDEEYGIPIRVVDEIEGMGVAEPVTDGGEVVRTPEGERELIDLGEAMASPGRDESRDMGGPEGQGMLVTLEDDIRGAAIRCDRVRGQQEVVVKPYEGFMSEVPGLSGAAILGEGEVVNILDVETL
jgi:two-component system chemotaxis sensor kinase CheA